MQWFIIGRDMHVLCSPSTDLPNTLPIDDSDDSSGQEIAITNNCAIGTYDFTTDPRHPDSVYITEGNYIAFRDKYGKDRLYTIMTIEGDEEWNVHCEDAGLDLINEYAIPWDFTARSIENTLNPVLQDTGWKIGINEVSSYKRATKFEGTTDSQLTRLGDVCNQFDAECDFSIEMQGSKVTKQEINIYKSIGEDKTQQRFIDNINLISLSRSGSIEDLITCIRCYGKEDENGNKLTISDIVYDDGRYYSPKGDIRIYDREAREKWSRFRAFNYEGQGEFDGYINGTFEYDTDNAQELFNRGLSELQSKNDVKVSYEANLYDLKADIGDTVQIADNSKVEKVYLSARIQSVKNHYTVSGNDTGTLGNYKILMSRPSTSVQQEIDKLKKQLVSIRKNDIAYQIGESGVNPPTGKWVSNPQQTEPGQYLWTRKITTYTNDSQSTEYSISRNGNNGTNGDNGSNAVIISLTSESTSIPCDIDGNPIDYTSASGTAFLYSGSSDISDEAIWSVEWEGMYGTFDNLTRKYQVITISEDVGKLTIKASYKGSVFEKKFTVTKVLKTINDYVRIEKVNTGSLILEPHSGTYLNLSIPEIQGYKLLCSLGVKSEGVPGLVGGLDTSYVFNSLDVEMTFPDVTVYFLYIRE